METLKVKVEKLPIETQVKIFELILKHKIKHTTTKYSVLFSSLDLTPAVIAEINNLVN
jgi:hypothetical protein